MRFSRPFSRKSRTSAARRASAAFPLPPLSAVSSEDDAGMERYRGESVSSFVGWRRTEEEEELRERVKGLEIELRMMEEEKEGLKLENQELQRVVKDIAGEGEGSVVARMRREVERLQWKVKEGNGKKQEEQGDLMMLIAKGACGDVEEEEEDWREREIERLEEVVMREWEEKTTLEEVVKELEERIEGREREIREGQQWKQKWRTERDRVIQLEKLAELEKAKWADRPRAQDRTTDRSKLDRARTPPRRRVSWRGGGAGFFTRAQSEI